MYIVLRNYQKHDKKTFYELYVSPSLAYTYDPIHWEEVEIVN